MKKIFSKLVMVVLGLVCLGGCFVENKNTRAYMEKHFSYLEKIYPTKNVEELFEKFPHGVQISHSIATRQENGSLDSSYFDLTVDSQKRRIYGTERKVNILHPNITEIYNEKVEYINGEITYPLNPKMKSQKLVFLFEQIDYKELKSFEERLVRYEYQQPSYLMGYWAPLNHYEFSNMIDQKVYLSISDNGRKNASVEIGRSDLRYYISEDFIGGENE